MDHYIPLNETERTALLLGSWAAMPMRLPLRPEVATYGRRFPDRIPSLRPREHSIVELIGQGYSNKEIGRELGITAETVKFYLKKIFRKLEVKKRAQAVTRAQELGLLRGRGDHRPLAVSGEQARIYASRRL